MMKYSYSQESSLSFHSGCDNRSLRSIVKTKLHHNKVNLLLHAMNGKQDGCYINLILCPCLCMLLFFLVGSIRAIFIFILVFIFSILLLDYVLRPRSEEHTS